MIPIPYLTVGLLLISNIFMTFAWYGHLKFKDSPLLLVILVSWGIALFEYCFQVPANRYGSNYFSPAQLKIIQEIVTLCVFVVFSALYLGEPIRWNHLVGFSSSWWPRFSFSRSGKASPPSWRARAKQSIVASSQGRRIAASLRSSP